MKLRIQSNVTYVFRCSGFNIMPGVNFIETAGNIFLEHPAVKARIDNNMLEVTECDEEYSMNFSEMNSKNLIKEVRQILDIKLLEKIKKEETRATVVQVLDAQIKKIKDTTGE